MTGSLCHMDAAVHLTNGCGLFQMMLLEGGHRVMRALSPSHDEENQPDGVG